MVITNHESGMAAETALANEESEEDMMRRRRESLDPSYNLKVRVLSRAGTWQL